MRRRNLAYILLSAIVLIFLAWPSFAQTKSIGDLVDQYLSVRADMGGFSGAVLIAKDGKVILRKGYGFADVEKKVPYTPETKHEVASISKMFTAMAALKLRDQGKVRLEDSICKYLEDCPDIWQPITVQHLMRHTSGIPDYEAPLELGSDKYMAFMIQPDAVAKIFANAKKLPLDFKPGEKFNYSNTGYIVLSHVVEKAAEQPFAAFVIKNILKPAGMTHSGVLGFSALPKDLATGYTHGDLGWEKTLAGVPLTDGYLRKVPRLPQNPPAGDGWLYTTVDDLYRWGELMNGSKLVPNELTAEVFTPGLGNYGYGWVIDEELGHKRERHTGSLPGYTSNFVRFPDERLTSSCSQILTAPGWALSIKTSAPSCSANHSICP